MKGQQIYFTQKELEALLNTLDEWQDLLLVEKEDEDKYAHRLEYGLGTAWGKLTEAKKRKQIKKTCKGCYAVDTGQHPLCGDAKGCSLGYKTNGEGVPLEPCPKPK